MGFCEDLINGYGVGCSNDQRLFIQKLVLINKSSVLEYLVRKSSIDIENNYNCAHDIVFRLKENESGKLISQIDNARNVSGTHERSEDLNVSEWNHSVSFIVQGYNESLICFLNNLNVAHYFAAAMLTDGTVIIYGFDNGLRPNNYSVDLQGNNGVTNIKLETAKGEEEQEQPYIYKSLNSTPESDFNNLFADIPAFEFGDFNNDFNNDFFI